MGWKDRSRSSTGLWMVGLGEPWYRVRWGDSLKGYALLSSLSGCAQALPDPRPSLLWPGNTVAASLKQRSR